MLCAVPLQSLLDWLSQPKGPNLVEASAATVPDKALVLEVTKQMLYGEDSIGGSGAHVQAPLHFHGAFQCCLHASACVACHGFLCGVSKQTKSSSCLIFVTVSEMSDVIPVVSQHPILLDVATKETII